MAIVITDGQPNVDAEKTGQEAEMALQQKVKMFSVGITEDVSESTLKTLASEPKGERDELLHDSRFQWFGKHYEDCYPVHLRKCEFIIF